MARTRRTTTAIPSATTATPTYGSMAAFRSIGRSSETAERSRSAVARV
jgi:hypothetical protein